MKETGWREHVMKGACDEGNMMEGACDERSM